MNFKDTGLNVILWRAGTDITPALEEGVPNPGGVPEASGPSSKNLAVKTQPAQIADSAQDMLPPRYGFRIRRALAVDSQRHRSSSRAARICGGQIWAVARESRGFETR